MKATIAIIITGLCLTVLLCMAQPPMPPVPPVREVEIEKIIRRIASDVLLVTNAKESVSVVTNVVESTNERGCQTCEMQRLHPELLGVYHPPHAGGLPYIAATEKYLTTICKQVSILTFTWRGVDRSMMEEQILWQTNQVWMLKSGWEEVLADGAPRSAQ